MAEERHYHVTDARGTPIVPEPFDSEAKARAEAIRQANVRYPRQWRECRKEHAL